MTPVNVITSILRDNVLRLAIVIIGMLTFMVVAETVAAALPSGF